MSRAWRTARGEPTVRLFPHGLLGAMALLSACTAVGGASGSSSKPGPAEPVVEPSAERPPEDAPPVPLEPPRLLTNPGSGVSVVWSGAAADVAVAGRNIVVLEPDGRHLDAIDWSNGEARWRIEQPFDEGARLYALDERVLVHDRDRAIVVEAARGRVLGRHPAPPSGHWPTVHGAERIRDACAWVGPCGIQAFDCTDGHPLGHYRASPQIHLYGTSDDPSEHSTSCSPQPRLLGRHGDAIVMLSDMPANDPREQSIPSMLAIDAATGQVRWHRALPSPETRAGITDDGGCWMLDEQAPGVAVVECDDGAPRWNREIGPGTLEVQAIEDTLVVARNDGGRWRLSAYGTADRRSVWSTRLARRQHPVLPRGPIPNAQVTGNRRVYALVDPSRGRSVGELVAGREERLWLDPGGGYVLIGRDLREIDPEGRLTRQRPFTGLGAHTVTSTHVLTHDGETIEIYDREQLRERARLEGRLTIEVPQGLPDDRLLLRRYGDDGVALVLALEPPSRGSGRR